MVRSPQLDGPVEVALLLLRSDLIPLKPMETNKLRSQGNPGEAVVLVVSWIQEPAQLEALLHCLMLQA